LIKVELGAQAPGFQIIRIRPTTKLRWVTPIPAASFDVADSELSETAGLTRNQFTATAISQMRNDALNHGDDIFHSPTPASPMPKTHMRTSAGITRRRWSFAMTVVSPAFLSGVYRNRGPNAAIAEMMWRNPRIR